MKSSSSFPVSPQFLPSSHTRATSTVTKTFPQARWVRVAGTLARVLGIGLRLARWLDPRPLWLDEVWIALNVLTRTPLEFLRPLDNEQMSPLGFLWAEWIMTHIGGFGERAFRLVPLVAAIIALVSFSRLARRMLPTGMALLATMLASLSPLLVYYSAEAKSYGFDWLCAILLMHTTLTVAEKPSDDAWIRWSVAAVFGAMFSTAAPFFVGACALAALTAPGNRTTLRSLLRVAAAATPAALVFGFHLLTIYQSSSTASYMRQYWTGMFLEPSVSAGLVRALNLTREFWCSVLIGGAILPALPRKTITVLVALSAMGAFALGRRSLAPPAMLVGPSVLAGAASFGHWWPLTPRLLLFAAPAVLITLPAGLAAVAGFLPRATRGPMLSILSVVLIAIAGVGLVREEYNIHDRFMPIGEALREVGAQASEDATIYVSWDLEPACIYYLAWHPDHAELNGEPRAKSCTLRGTRSVIGSRPEWVGIAPGTGAFTATVLRPEWLEREVHRIVEQTSGELWVLVGLPRRLQATLPTALDESGALSLSRREVGKIHSLKYDRR